mmetsp:Transcript_4864/g.13505  ORF Transcript_4864/g.13505 Transcript_4864/m.13505 type:complete len:239 (-) Transcript_4864:341-1057(-)
MQGHIQQCGSVDAQPESITLTGRLHQTLIASAETSGAPSTEAADGHHAHGVCDGEEADLHALQRSWSIDITHLNGAHLLSYHRISFLQTPCVKKLPWAFVTRGLLSHRLYEQFYADTSKSDGAPSWQHHHSAKSSHVTFVQFFAFQIHRTTHGARQSLRTQQHITTSTTPAVPGPLLQLLDVISTEDLSDGCQSSSPGLIVAKDSIEGLNERFQCLGQQNTCSIEREGARPRALRNSQ